MSARFSFTASESDSASLSALAAAAAATSAATDGIYQACYPLAVERRDSQAYGDDEHDGGVSGGRGCGSGSVSGVEFAKIETRSRSFSVESSSFADDDEAFSYEEECSLELCQVLLAELEKQILLLLRVSLSCSPLFAIDAPGLRSTLDHVVKDILRESEDEPYGVRGVTLRVKLRPSDAAPADFVDAAATDATAGGEDRLLGCVVLDGSTVSTFELDLILHEERGLSVAFRDWLALLLTHGPSQQRRKRVHIRADYELRKRKLYRGGAARGGRADV